MFVYVWVGLGFFLSLLTSSYDAINMFFHIYNVTFCNHYTTKNLQAGIAADCSRRPDSSTGPGVMDSEGHGTLRPHRIDVGLEIDSGRFFVSNEFVPELLLLLLLLLLLNTPKLGAREKIKSADREHQWLTGLYSVANRGLKGSWTDHWYTQIQPQEFLKKIKIKKKRKEKKMMQKIEG